MLLTNSLSASNIHGYPLKTRRHRPEARPQSISGGIDRPATDNRRLRKFLDVTQQSSNTSSYEGQATPILLLSCKSSEELEDSEPGPFVRSSRTHKRQRDRGVQKERFVWYVSLSVSVCACVRVRYVMPVRKRERERERKS